MTPPSSSLGAGGGRSEDYGEASPGAEHVGAVVEVADATLLRDRQLKARIYARAGIPTYCLVNLVERHVEVSEAPAPDEPSPRYQRQTISPLDAQLVVILDGKRVGQVRVADLLP